MCKYFIYLEVPIENALSNDVNVNLINILQRVLDAVVISFENNDVGAEHQVVLLKMFQSLEILYNNIRLTQEQAKSVHDWLHMYCKMHKADGAEHTIVHKLLFTQRIRTQKGGIFEGIAKQIEMLAGQILDVMFTFKSFPIFDSILNILFIISF